MTRRRSSTASMSISPMRIVRCTNHSCCDSRVVQMAPAAFLSFACAVSHLARDATWMRPSECHQYVSFTKDRTNIATVELRLSGAKWADCESFPTRATPMAQVVFLAESWLTRGLKTALAKVEADYDGW